MNIDPKIFKAYDVRGIYPDEIDEELVYLIAKAYAEIFKPKRAALGHDVRISSPALFKYAKEALLESGVDVVDIGMISTDMLYFAVGKYGLDGGIVVTASHNAKEYNGMKFVREKVVPVSGDSGIYEIRDYILKNQERLAERGKPKGKSEKKEILEDYLNHILSFVEPRKIKKFKIVANPNFGMAGRVLEKLAEKIPLDIIPLNFEPDGNFPKGKPDPLLAETRKETEELVKSSGADFGVSWDADADRCFFFDENGNFINGYYTVGIFAKYFLKKNPGGKIIHDPRLVWATIDAVKEAGGIPLKNKVGHSFIKERMRKENAVFAAENSGHYYFRDNFYADNGMIPFLVMLEMLSQSGQKMSELFFEICHKYFIDEESNFTIEDKEGMMKKIAEQYSDGQTDWMDGLSVEYLDWRFNLRPSNTEPLLRLNLESYSQKLLEQKKEELVSLIAG